MYYYFPRQIYFFDEIGLISWEQLAVIDRALRIIKDIEAPFGGALFFASGDHHQLKAINDTPVWWTPLLYSSIRPILLEHLVRSRGDNGD